MARRRRTSTFGLLRPLIQAATCAAGLLGGIAIGAWIVFSTGLLSKWGQVLSAPLDSMTKNDLFIVIGSIAIVFGLGWLGARIGLTLAAKMQP